MIRTLNAAVFVTALVHCGSVQAESESEPATPTPMYLDTNRPVEERVADLIAQMTLEEKVTQFLHHSKAIDRLNVPAYHWWSECLHGVARAGRATVFPQAIGMAATFDEDLISRVASCIGDEARAKYHAAERRGQHRRYGGLTFWTPNINIFRDPRWGRGQETYGEDPFLTGRLGAAFVRGLQGDHPRYLKAAACAKHFAVHSGPEAIRHQFDAAVSPKDLHETYLPAFKSLVDASVEGVMCAYNRVNGQPCCGCKTLLTDILRNDWGFEGYVVSDCWALDDMHLRHKVTASALESAALAINNGVDLNCGHVFSKLAEAVQQGLVSEATIDRSLAHLLRTQFRLGLFDPPEMNPYTAIGPEVVDCAKHRALAREAAVKSIVLLKNRDNVLPLRRDIADVLVVGPNATSVDVLLGNYYGLSSSMVTILEGIVDAVEPGGSVRYWQGCMLDQPNAGSLGWSTEGAKEADAVIAVLGISGLLEGERGTALASVHQGDRLDLNLPAHQLDYLRKLRAATAKPLIVVLTGGSPIAMPAVHELADAVLFVWYPGEEGGNAVADVLFGNASPSGRLPVTFPRSVDQLPPYDDYRMTGRTYRYAQQEPLYPFGFGLAYTTFDYGDVQISPKAVHPEQNVTVQVTVTNSGNTPGQEVVQMYLTDVEASVQTPRWSLQGFQRINLQPGQGRSVTFTVTPEMMEIVDQAGHRKLEPGAFRVTVGGASPGQRSQDLGAPAPVTATFDLAG